MQTIHLSQQKTLTLGDVNYIYPRPPTVDDLK